MQNHVYLKTGKIFFAFSILSIGLIHIVSGNFPAGLLPVPSSLPGKSILTYLNGIALIAAGVLILIKKYTQLGALLAGFTLFIFLLFLHIPKLLQHLRDPTEWTGTFEVVALFSGALILVSNKGYKLLLTGRYIFAVALLVFGIQHYMYAQFITSLIPAWVPWPLFWAYLVMAAFIAAAVSIMIKNRVRLSATLLGLMFLIWVLMLHLPRVITHTHTETEWTSMFVALAMCGTAFLIAGSTDVNRRF